MALVHEYVWYVLPGALVFGFVLAWILRGLKKSPAEQRAIVDRDIALLELQQTKDELDSLFAAQRKFKAEAKAAADAGADPALRAQVEKLQAELAAAKAGLEAAPRAQAESVSSPDVLSAPAPEAAPAPARQTPSGPSPEEAAMRKALIARNEYLEGRIHDVELRLHHMSKELSVAKADGASAERISKEAWLANYLGLRAEALQAKLQETLKSSGEEQVSADEQTAPKLSQEDAEARDEEMARLRWRNRYLESRLAYLGQPSSRPAAPSAPAAGAGQGTVTPAKPAAAPVRPAQPATGPRLADTSPERLASRGPRFTSPFSELASSAPPKKPAPAVAAPSSRPTPIKPPAKQTADGQADDLTRISGLSSSIELKLNEIGIWHYAQIANWTDQHLEWVDRSFGLDGQAKREGWVSQARQLIASA
ncbi:MAG TPA: hypothetical protein EYG02_02190 [Henriciella marina]|uniref:hypothetical protein n=1 Tax=Henriciella sp. TaxID=1968823 RepID=UPI0017AFDB47|nr:hypothetical protein [Henriciella sp.]HIG21320.1 hypothetical protein [Henriciella sp.]HIK63823.1 hypothetical protein [Henriciella marina]